MKRRIENADARYASAFVRCDQAVCIGEQLRHVIAGDFPRAFAVAPECSNKLPAMIEDVDVGRVVDGHRDRSPGNSTTQ